MCTAQQQNAHRQLVYIGELHNVYLQLVESSLVGPEDFTEGEKTS